jgi:hypothetical protein
MKATRFNAGAFFTAFSLGLAQHDFLQVDVLLFEDEVVTLGIIILPYYFKSVLRKPSKILI